MALKKSYQEVYNFFKQERCELLVSEYINSKTLMRYICSCGNESKIRWNDFQQGLRCKRCGYKKAHNINSHSFEYIQNEFKKENCELLETFYINSKTKMKYKCICGNISSITFGNFRSGYRCKICGIEKMSGENHPLWIKDRKKVKSRKTIHHLSWSYKRRYRKEYNITDSNIHIDHIFPIKAFVEHGIYDLDLINHQSNFQILSKKENLSKSGKYNKEKFIIFLNNIKSEKSNAIEL